VIVGGHGPLPGDDRVVHSSSSHRPGRFRTPLQHFERTGPTRANLDARKRDRDHLCHRGRIERCLRQGEQSGDASVCGGARSRGPPCAGASLGCFGVSVDQATERLLRLLHERGDRRITAAEIEKDGWFSANRGVTAAAAHALATDVSIDVGEQTDVGEWFPYSFMMVR
jgi:hypothetical protein